MTEQDAQRVLAAATREIARSEWLTIKAYARIYGIDRHTVYKWLAHGGILEVYQVGTLRRIRHQPPRQKCA